MRGPHSAQGTGRHMTGVKASATDLEARDKTEKGGKSRKVNHKKWSNMCPSKAGVN